MYINFVIDPTTEIPDPCFEYSTTRFDLGYFVKFIGGFHTLAKTTLVPVYVSKLSNLKYNLSKFEYLTKE